MSAAVAALAALAGLAGCGGADAGRTGAEPPDRLVVVAEGGGVGRLSFDLDCAIADHDACQGVLAAIVSADDPQTCEPVAGGDRLLRVDGTIGGGEVHALLQRRTDCEVAAYDAAARAVGL